MGVSDFINLLAIIVAIVVGFFITHWYSVRDTRVRTIKDHYIEQIKSFKGRVDVYFRKLLCGKLSARQFIDWYYNIDFEIKGLDKGLRYSLDIRKKELNKIVGDAFDEITDLEDFNNQYSAKKVYFNIEAKENVKKLFARLDDDFNMYIAIVNHANTYGLFTTQWKTIKENYSFYSDKEKNVKAWLLSFRERLEKHWKEGLVMAFIIYVLATLYLRIDNQDRNEQRLDSLIREVENIRRDQDSIASGVFELSRKYQPNVLYQKTQEYKR